MPISISQSPAESSEAPEVVISQASPIRATLRHSHFECNVGEVFQAIQAHYANTLEQIDYLVGNPGRPEVASFAAEARTVVRDEFVQRHTVWKEAVKVADIRVTLELHKMNQLRDRMAGTYRP